MKRLLTGLFIMFIFWKDGYLVGFASGKSVEEAQKKCHVVTYDYVEKQYD